MKSFKIHASLALLSVLTALATVPQLASAQMPTPTAKTPTLHGGTPIQGSAVGGQVGYAALRADFFHGAGNWDLNVSAGLTFGDRWLHGYNQSLGLDLRVPFRIRVAEWRRGTGSFKIGPLFHVGRGCEHRYYSCRGRGCAAPRCPGPGCDAPRCPGPDCRDGDWCDTRSIGTGVTLGFVADIALPKLFKLILGVEQQLGVLNLDHRPTGIDHTYFAGATWLDLGLEAFWRDAIFFTLIMNVGAQYGSDDLHYARHALFRHLVGAAYKFR